MIANSNILVLSVKFFDYEKLIADQLIAMGASVDLFDERPSNTFLSKAIIRLKKNVYTSVINRHFKGIMRKIVDKRYNYFLLIKGESTPLFFLKFLKENNPGIVFIYYNYDSFKNNPNGLENLMMFDRKFSFDKNDSDKYQLGFRPLFFSSHYAKLNDQSTHNSSAKYDIAFIGTAHSDRYQISQTIAKWCIENSLRMFNFYFSPSKILFAFKKLTDRHFSGFDRSKISFRSLSHMEIMDIYRNSNAILDINHPNQNGLTMRTFETLGSGRKLVTTNTNIKSYPFYNDTNVYIIDRSNPNIDLEFFNREFEPIDSNLLFAMSLEGWLKELFEGKSNIW